MQLWRGNNRMMSRGENAWCENNIQKPYGRGDVSVYIPREKIYLAERKNKAKKLMDAFSLFFLKFYG